MYFPYNKSHNLRICDSFNELWLTCTYLICGLPQAKGCFPGVHVPTQLW